MSNSPINMDHLPAPLLPMVSRFYQTFIESGGETLTEWCVPQDAHRLVSLWAQSQYAARICSQQPDVLPILFASGQLARHYDRADFSQQWESDYLQRVQDAPSLMSALRLYRHQHMVRILWRYAAAEADIVHTMRELSLLAEHCLDCALKWHYQQLCIRHGITYAAEHPVPMVVLGLGKLGGSELNFSSDVDLIFTYPYDSEQKLEQELYIILAQQLVTTMGEMTEQGFVFRMDMRLRPYGQSSALVCSDDALLRYYEKHGRDWERYALLKARPVAGDIEAGYHLLERLRPFIYRRYLDFAAIDSLREMHALWHKQSGRTDLSINIKLGAGSIREAEFTVQALQLLRGGQVGALRHTNFLMVARTIQRLGIMASSEMECIIEGYSFLRRCEHVLQGWNDQQTQQLPHNALEQCALAYGMGYETWDDFCIALQAHRDNVRQVFADVVGTSPASTDATTDVWQVLWPEIQSVSEAQHLLEEKCFRNPQETLKRLDRFRRSTALQQMQSIARDRTDQLMPLMFETAAASSNPDQAMEFGLRFTETMYRRSSYLLLLITHPSVLQLLMQLYTSSRWIGTTIVRFPDLLDELLDARVLYGERLVTALHPHLKIMWDNADCDEESQLNSLRYFKISQLLNITARYIKGRLDIINMGAALSRVAEVILQQVVMAAWEKGVRTYGTPYNAEGQMSLDDFAVIAYGKLGTDELGYGSDLDLVFIYDAEPTMMTDGDSAIDNALFFTHLAQRIIYMLTTQTALGELYEIDTRLRPSGRSGLLVTSWKSFARYQHEEAWIWEHQALVRARTVVGGKNITQRFIDLRREILCRERDVDELRDEIGKMRTRMQVVVKSPSKQTKLFDLKSSAGGIVDIEFIVQFAVLSAASRYADLIESYDTTLLLARCSERVLSANIVKQLQEAYVVLRGELYRRELQQESMVGDSESLVLHRQAVLDAWRIVMHDE